MQLLLVFNLDASQEDAQEHSTLKLKQHICQYVGLLHFCPPDSHGWPCVFQQQGLS
jgi:hypothetical protein